MITTGFKIKEVYVRWIGITLLSILFSQFIDVDKNQDPIERFLLSFLHTGIYWNGSVLIIFYFRKQYPRVSQTPKKLLLTVLSILLFLSVVDPILDFLTSYDEFMSELSVSSISIGILSNLLISSALGMFYETVFFFDQWKRSIKLAEELKNQQIKTQIEVLQNQMSPHFLFNSLNALSTLIMEDQKSAVDFTDHLSEVYRYILQNKDKELVQLKTELAFVRSYVYLLKIRYPENLDISYEIEDDYLEYYIAPLTLQMLVENSIKHNIISNQQPLRVNIYVGENETLIVENNLQKKKVIEKSTKTGLMNIKKRYAFFGNKNISVSEQNDQFRVGVPLLSVMKNEEFVLS